MNTLKNIGSKILIAVFVFGSSWAAAQAAHATPNACSIAARGDVCSSLSITKYVPDFCTNNSYHLAQDLVSAGIPKEDIRFLVITTKNDYDFIYPQAGLGNGKKWKFDVVVQVGGHIVDTNLRTDTKSGMQFVAIENYFRTIFGTKNVDFKILEVRPVSFAEYVTARKEHSGFAYEQHLLSSRQKVISLDEYLRQYGLDPLRIQTQSISTDQAKDQPQITSALAQFERVRNEVLKFAVGTKIRMFVDVARDNSQGYYDVERQWSFGVLIAVHPRTVEIRHGNGQVEEIPFGHIGEGTVRSE